MLSVCDIWKCVRHSVCQRAVSARRALTGLSANHVRVKQQHACQSANCCCDSVSKGCPSCSCCPICPSCLHCLLCPNASWPTHFTPYKYQNFCPLVSYFPSSLFICTCSCSFHFSPLKNFSPLTLFTLLSGLLCPSATNSLCVLFNTLVSVHAVSQTFCVALLPLWSFLLITC